MCYFSLDILPGDKVVLHAFAAVALRVYAPPPSEKKKKNHHYLSVVRVPQLIISRDIYEIVPDTHSYVGCVLRYITCRRPSLGGIAKNKLNVTEK